MNINLFKSPYLLLFIPLFIYSCSDQGELSEEIDELAGVVTHSELTLSGETKAQNSAVNYFITTNDTDVFQIKVLLDGQTLEASISYNDESIKIDGHSAQLANNQKAALLETAQKLFTYVDGLKTSEEVSLLEYSLIRMLEYWSNSPKGYTYEVNNIPSPLTSDEIAGRQGNEGITCIRRNTTVNAEYDDSRGVHSDRVRVGSRARANYGCMGRCGPDCGRWWIPSAWTKDCMDHDQCSNVNNSSGGGGDSNCGDEFNQAADDYVFGVIRGCRG